MAMARDPGRNLLIPGLSPSVYMRFTKLVRMSHAGASNFNGLGNIAFFLCNDGIALARAQSDRLAQRFPQPYPPPSWIASALFEIHQKRQWVAVRVRALTVNPSGFFGPAPRVRVPPSTPRRSARFRPGAAPAISQNAARRCGRAAPA